MGLDHYLYARNYVGSYQLKDKKVRDALAKALGLTEKDYSTEVGFYVEIPKITWRKVNQIHNWFVENIQNGEDDCGRYEFTVEEIIPLRELCKKVLDNHELAEELLPRVSGLFYGSHEYDEYYFEQLQNVHDELTSIIETSDLHNYLVYTSSW